MRKSKVFFRKINLRLLRAIVVNHPYLAPKEELDEFINKQVSARKVSLVLGFAIYLVIFGLLLQEKSLQESFSISLLIFGFGCFILGLSQIISYSSDYPTISFFYLLTRNYYAGVTSVDLEEIYSQNRQVQSVKELASLGTKKFCLKYFNKGSPGFIKFYQSRAIPLEIHGRAFINYSLSVPKAKEMSVDMLRKVLLCYDPVFKNGIINLEIAFSLYTLDEIEAIFTTPSSKSCLLIKEFKTPLPKAKKFSELERLIIKRALPPSVSCLHQKEVDGFSFRVLMTQSEYNEISDLFSNCVRGYWNEQETYIIVAYKQLFPVACIELQNGIVRQISGIKNREVFEKGALIKVIKQIIPKNKIFRARKLNYIKGFARGDV